MLATHAVGIDLGTTYSCLAYLNEHGEPVSIPNLEGELSTPSVVLFEHGRPIVGTEALRNAIVHPDRVVQNSKRWMGDSRQRWMIDGREYNSVDIAECLLRKLLSDAERQIGKVERAVITVPAQFSDVQRQATIEAGQRAGLKYVDVINEPVAAALCYVLGAEGLWFTELANEQRILVYDLGGGTFDLSLVKYQQNEVRVLASTGDLHLGGIDWNQVLLEYAADEFTKEFKSDPRQDPESLQYLAWEVEQTKRSLSVRPRAALSCQHGGKRKTYQIEQEQFNRLAAPLVKRTEEITKRLLKDHQMGWAHVDVVLITGGGSRMPMVRDMLKTLSGRTLNTSLSPDQSIAHGATYYAGMLISNNEFVKSILNADANARLAKVRQQSVTARALGILIRDPVTNRRVPHYLIPANTPLPASVTQIYGTVVPNQKRVNLQIIESGARPELPYVGLGTCAVEELPERLPQESEIAVTISYDASARVHVSARDVASGKVAMTEIVRVENLLQMDADQGDREYEIALPSAPVPSQPARKGAPVVRDVAPPAAKSPRAVPSPPVKPVLPEKIDESTCVPVPLCHTCGKPLNDAGRCRICGPERPAAAKKGTPAPVSPTAGKSPPPRPSASPRPAAKATPPAPSARAVPPVKPGTPGTAKSISLKPAKLPSTFKPASSRPVSDDEIIDLSDTGALISPGNKPAPPRPPSPIRKSPPPVKQPPQPRPKPVDDDDDLDFWKEDI